VGGAGGRGPPPPDLVVGNRFKGGVASGAMPPLHRYLGNPVLSFIGRLFFNSKIKDFHCGIRGYNRDAILSLNLHTSGMEYASEMIVQATLNNLKITEVPTTLDKDGRSRPPHLRSWSDGWRHLKFLFMYSPNWLFVYPGIFFLILGFAGMIALFGGTISLGGIGLDMHTMLYAGMFAILGFNLILFSVFTKIYAWTHNYLPRQRISGFYRNFIPDRCIFIGFLLFLFGVLLAITALLIWQRHGFGNLDASLIMRLTLPSVVCIVIGTELIFSGFFTGILQIKK
jgi:hypothetical protein